VEQRAGWPLQPERARHRRFRRRHGFSAHAILVRDELLPLWLTMLDGTETKFPIQLCHANELENYSVEIARYNGPVDLAPC